MGRLGHLHLQFRNMWIWVFRRRWFWRPWKIMVVLITHFFSFIFVICDFTYSIRLLLLLSGDNGADSLIELLLTYQVFIYTPAFIRNSLMTLLRACKIICIYKWCEMQAICNDPSVDKGSASPCVPQAAKDSDDDDDLESWDDDDADEGNRGPTFDESSDEVFSCSPLVTVCIYFSFWETCYASSTATNLIINTSALNLFQVIMQ